MHNAMLGVAEGGHHWFVWCETCARGSKSSPSRTAVRDLLAAHLIDPAFWPITDTDPETFSRPADLLVPPRWI